MLTIISLEKYKEKYRLKEIAHRVLTNMVVYNDFSEIAQIDLDKGDKCQSIAEEIIKDKGITSGLFVWHRTYKSRLPVMVIFYKNKKKEY